MNGSDTQPHWAASISPEELYFRDAQLSQALNENLPAPYLEHLIASLKSVPELSSVFINEAQRTATLDEINADEKLRGALGMLIRNGGAYLQAYLAHELHVARAALTANTLPSN